MSTVVAQAMNSPDTVKLLAADGSEPIPPTTPAEFKAKFGQPAGQPTAQTPSNIVKLPPSLSRMASAGQKSVDAGDMSDESLFRHARS